MYYINHDEPVKHGVQVVQELIEDGDLGWAGGPGEQQYQAPQGARCSKLEVWNDKLSQTILVLILQHTQDLMFWMWRQL